MHRVRLSWISTAIACLLWGCAVNADAPSTTQALPFHYQKTMCFGPCPAFTFTVSASGAASLDIVRPLREAPLNALEPGRYSSQLEDVTEWNHKIAAAAAEVNHDRLDSLYDNPRVTDLPATITIYNGKSVTNRYNGPDLTTLYAALDEAMATLNWHHNETK